MKLLERKNMLLLFVLLGAILIMSVGYASINSVTGDIEGTALADAQEGVFITNIEYVSDVNASASNSRVNKFLGTVMDSTMQLSDSDANSSITYKVTVYNKGIEEAIFQKIRYANDFYDNNDIIFDISGFTTGEKIGPGESRDIIITFKYNGTTVPSNTVLNSYLNFVIKAPNRMVVATKHNVSSSGYLRGNIYKSKIETIAFKMGKESDVEGEIKSKFDASEKKDGSIMGYYTDENNDGMYDLTFISEDIIYANKDAADLFYNFTNLKSIDFTNFRTDGVTDMSGMFGSSNINNLDLSVLDTSDVIDMSNMFAYCKGLTELDLSNFDTRNVTNMNYMFGSFSSVSKLNLSNFDTSKVTNMSDMFRYCNNLSELDLSSFNTNAVTTMQGMFWDCKNLTKLNLSNFDTSNVTDMSYMFEGCSSLTKLNVGSFNTSNVTDMSWMFDRCSSLTELDLSNFNTSKVTTMWVMLSGLSAITSLNVSGFDTHNVTNMAGIFYDCSQLTSLDVSGFNTSKVKSMSSMFDGCNSLTSLDVSNFNTSEVTDMNRMFFDCNSLTELDLSNFDTVCVTRMEDMFLVCSKLTTIYVSEYNSTSQKGWTTENVTDSTGMMFSACSKLVGGNGTKFSSSHTDKTYARIDTADTPGYFTKKN